MHKRNIMVTSCKHTVTPSNKLTPKHIHTHAHTHTHTHTHPKKKMNNCHFHLECIFDLCLTGHLFRLVGCLLYCVQFVCTIFFLVNFLSSHHCLSSRDTLAWQ